MIVVQIMMLIGVLLLLPVLVGTIFSPLYEGGGKLPFYWISGQLLLWAGFQVLAVPMVITQNSFGRILRSYLLFLGAMLLVSLGAFLKRRSKGMVYGKLLQSMEWRIKPTKSIWWLVVAALLILQLVCVIFLAYEEGDDAFYVALSTSSLDDTRLYGKLPYSGWHSALERRHALAPFPVWISFVAKMTGFHPAFLAHVILPLLLIPMSYGVYYLLGSRLFAEKRQCLPVFLALAEGMTLFGGYSLYSAENFLLVRTAQGKAVLCSIIIPFLILMLYLLLHSLDSGNSPAQGYWVLFAVLLTAGCLCSTLGTFLLCMLSGLTAVCGVLCYRRIPFAFRMALCMIIPAGFAGLYFVLD